MTNLLILLTLTPELNNQYRDRLKAKFPQLHVDLVDHHSKVGPYIASADILLTFAPRLSDDVLRAGTKLKWVQALGTGVDNLIDRPVLRKDVIVTNIHGIHGAPVSEAAIGSMLALARDIPRALRAQGAREWARFPAKLLHNKTVGVFGIGAIAEELAPKCKAFGMRTIGVSSAPRAVAGFDRMVSSAELADVAGEFDFFVLLDAAHGKNPQQRRCQSARRDEADKFSGQSRPRRCRRRAGAGGGASDRAALAEQP